MGQSMSSVKDAQGRTLGLYVARSIVGLLQAFTPAAWGFVAYHHLIRTPGQGSSTLYIALLAYAHAEVLFTLWHVRAVRSAQARIMYDIEQDPQATRDLLRLCLDSGLGGRPKSTRGASQRQDLLGSYQDVTEDEAATLRTKFKTWFHHTPLEDVGADNVREWLAWALADGRTLSEAQADPVARELVEGGLDTLQQRLRITFPKGYNVDAKPIRLTLDPVKVMTRPMAFYVALAAATGVTYAWLMASHGFRFHTSHGVQMLVRPASAPGKGRPIIFLHGLGVGLAQYAHFLSSVGNSQRGAVLVLQPHISAQAWHPRFLRAPTATEFVAAIESGAVAASIHSGAAVVSHSNGTMQHGWLARRLPGLCAQNVLVDPVSLKLWEGDVCHSFLHREWRTSGDVLLGFAVARELGVARTISRDFQWRDMLLWEWELPVEPDTHTLRVVLGTDDALIDARGIARHLVDECGIPQECVRLMPGHEHGDSLVKRCSGLAAVLDALQLSP